MPSNGLYSAVTWVRSDASRNARTLCMVWAALAAATFCAPAGHAEGFADDHEKLAPAHKTAPAPPRPPPPSLPRTQSAPAPMDVLVLACRGQITYLSSRNGKVETTHVFDIIQELTFDLKAGHLLKKSENFSTSLREKTPALISDHRIQVSTKEDDSVGFDSTILMIDRVTAKYSLETVSINRTGSYMGLRYDTRVAGECERYQNVTPKF
jgi:hypothetical protein